METFSVIIAALVFALGWNTVIHERSDNLLLLGCAFLAAGMLDFLHLLSYEGMPDMVTPASIEKAINFWLIARLLIAVSLLVVAINPWNKKICPEIPTVVVSLIIVAISSWLILFRPEKLPQTFMPGKGLTNFKIGFEYLLILIYLMAAILLWLRKHIEQRINLEILAIASIIMGLAELFFTLYTSSTDLYNLTGHIYKVIAYIMVYQAVFVSSVKEPYERLQQASLIRLKLTQFAVDHSADMVFWLDSTGRIVNANDASQQCLDYSLKDLTALHLSNIEQGLTSQIWNSIWEKASRMKRLQRECVFQTASGKLLPVEMTGNYVSIENVDYLCAFVRDISDRKQAELVLKNSESRLKEAQKIARLGSWELNLEKDKLTWSDEIFSIFEIDQASFKASYQAFLEAIHPEDREKVDTAYKISVDEHKPYSVRHRLLLKSGKIKHVIENGQTTYSDDGHPIRSVGTVQDITSLVESEQALKHVNIKLTERAGELLEQQNKASLLNEMSELMLICQSEEECYNVTASFCKRLFSGSSGGLFILDPSKKQAETVATWGDKPPVETSFEASQCWTLRRGHINQVDEPDTALICPHIKKLPLAGYIGLPISAQGEMIGVMELFWPISHMKLSIKKRSSTHNFQIKIAHTLVDHLALALINLRLRETLQKQAIHDPLTGLYNRRFLDDALEREIRRAIRKSASFGVIMIDVDHFKKINDEYGHDAGDVLLRDIAIQFQSHLRAEDLVCRYGGEEFVALLPEANLEEAEQRAEEIRETIEKRIIEFAGQQMNVTISAGVAMYSSDNPKTENLIKAADEALYCAKNSGRNKVVTANSI